MQALYQLKLSNISIIPYTVRNGHKRSNLYLLIVVLFYPRRRPLNVLQRKRPLHHRLPPKEIPASVEPVEVECVGPKPSKQVPAQSAVGMPAQGPK